MVNSSSRHPFQHPAQSFGRPHPCRLIPLKRINKAQTRGSSYHPSPFCGPKKTPPCTCRITMTAFSQSKSSPSAVPNFCTPSQRHPKAAKNPCAGKGCNTSNKKPASLNHPAAAAPSQRSPGFASPAAPSRTAYPPAAAPGCSTAPASCPPGRAPGPGQRPCAPY